jgi:hypothetical protein
MTASALSAATLDTGKRFPSLVNILWGKTDSPGEYEGSQGAFAADSLDFLDELLGFVGLLPGFEWLEAVSFGLSMAAEGVSMSCLIEDELGSE